MLSIVLLSFLMASNIDAIDICEENNGNPRISVGLRINDYTVLISSHKKVYRIENFNLEANHFNYSNIEDLTEEWIISGKIELSAFPIRYHKNNTEEIRIVHLRKEKSEDLVQIFSYQTLHSKDLKNVMSEDRISTLIYKYRSEPTDSPLYDPLTLMTLFAKFPSDGIETNMKTITGFPLNRPNIPFRLFVYYLETPTKRLMKENKSESIFKRHIMIGRKVFYGSPNSSVDDDIEDREIDWQHDINSGKCIEEDVVVDAAFPLTDYTSVGNHLQFDIIEFSGDLYFVKRVKLNDQKVEQHLQVLKSGTIGSIFGCKTSATVPDSSQTISTSSVTLVHKTSESNVKTALIWTTNIALVVVVLTIALMLYQIFFGRPEWS